MFFLRLSVCDVIYELLPNSVNVFPEIVNLLDANFVIKGGSDQLEGVGP